MFWALVDVEDCLKRLQGGNKQRHPWETNLNYRRVIAKLPDMISTIDANNATSL